MSLRRSSRLKDKEEREKNEREELIKFYKQGAGSAPDEDCNNGSEDYSPAEEESSDEADLPPVVIATPRNKITPQKSNDFLRVCVTICLPNFRSYISLIYTYQWCRVNAPMVYPLPYMIS